jgi:hypothetical protein
MEESVGKSNVLRGRRSLLARGTAEPSKLFLVKVPEMGRKPRAWGYPFPLVYWNHQFSGN